MLKKKVTIPGHQGTGVVKYKFPFSVVFTVLAPSQDVMKGGTKVQIEFDNMSFASAGDPDLCLYPPVRTPDPKNTTKHIESPISLVISLGQVDIERKPAAPRYIIQCSIHTEHNISTNMLI
ncbi:hypothetical protein TWF751_006835 [Orbilia oligospora]|nr:hypothetical protein TWF751_006835 [Orbilia oligospora]